MCIFFPRNVNIAIFLATPQSWITGILNPLLSVTFSRWLNSVTSLIQPWDLFLLAQILALPQFTMGFSLAVPTTLENPKDLVFIEEN